MKKLLFLALALACLLLAAVGCSKSNYQKEQTLRGEWREAGEDFTATFSDSHTGFVSFRGRKQPFAWMILTDGRVQVTDPAGQVIYLKFDDNNLHIEGTKSILIKIK
jgi:hypothetical protein